jgi:uroporphyrinogen-III synthase
MFWRRSMATKVADMSLTGLRVLVTRPAARADELLVALRERGAQVLHIPLLDIRELDVELDAESMQRNRVRVLDLDHYQKLIFISANAVRHGGNLVDQFWPQWPAQQELLAIGAATSSALADRGLTAVSAQYDTMDSESLLASACLQAVSGERIAIFRGLGGRETLATALRARGARVDYIECYRRAAPRLDAVATLSQIEHFAATALVVNSGETLENLTGVLPVGHELFQCALVLPSERVAVLASKLGYAKAIVATNAGTAATLAALHTIIADAGL